MITESQLRLNLKSCLLSQSARCVGTSLAFTIGLFWATSADAGCIAGTASCSPSINAQGEVGATDYSRLPFAGGVFAESFGASPDLFPVNLFWQSGKNFTDTAAIGNARRDSAALTAMGVVPVGGVQRWEDTYEASMPASLFPGEPGWVAADRNALAAKPEFKAWAAWEKAHAGLFILGADGGSEGTDFRQWHGNWGHISPMMPLPPGDWPPDVKNATYGDWFAYRWGQTAVKSGAYGILLSDFTDSQPGPPSYQIGFNPQLVDAFAVYLGKPMPAGSIPQRAGYINAHYYPQWNDYLAHGYAQFYKALAHRLSATGHAPLVINQCGTWPSYRRLQGNDGRFIAAALPSANYACLWDDQTMQIGRSGQPMIWGIGGMVLAAAREPDVRNGGNLSADDPAFWQAASYFWSGLTPAMRRERGLKELKRAWLETAWSHIATRQGSVRRALAFMSRDYWDQGALDSTVAKLIQSVVPTRPFGYAVYYSQAGERAAEAAVPRGGTTYMDPDLLLAFKNGGGAVGYYVSSAALPALTAAATPAAWIVLDDRIPKAEVAKLAKTAPVLTSVQSAKAFANAPLSFSEGLTGMAFYDQTGRLIVMVSNPGDKAITGSVTLRTIGLGVGLFDVVNLFTGQSSGFLSLTGQASLSLTVDRWDTQVFAIGNAL